MELFDDMNMTMSGIVMTSQWLGCWAVRLEALLMRRVIVTHRNPVELSGEMSKTKSGIVTTCQWLGCWAVRLEALPVGSVIVIHRNPVELSGDMSKTKSVSLRPVNGWVAGLSA